jgi:iron complex outermembrane receptor protein
MLMKNSVGFCLNPAGWGTRTFVQASICALALMAFVAPVAAQNVDQDEENVLEEVIVTGMRATLESAQNIKFQSETIVDSIVADDIANLPDRSVTETLQRIPGVTIDRFISRGDPEHFGGEGSGVAVRGLTQVRGEINGRDGFTANGGRSLSFEDVPPELLAGIDVYKNATADMIEGGLGGTVNLRTRMPLDIDQQLIAFTATANYQNFIEETTPGFSAMYSGRWDTNAGEFGFLVDLAYSELKGRIDVLFSRPYFPRNSEIGGGGYEIPGTSGTVWAPRGADWRTERTDRERQGAYAAFQWRPNDDMEYYATLFRSEYDFTWDEDALFVDNDPYGIFPTTGPSGTTPGDWSIDGDGVFESGTLSGWRFDDTNGDGVQDTWNQIGIPMGSDIRVSNRNSVTTDFSQGFIWQINDRWEFTTDLQYVKATTEGLDSTIGAGITVPEMFVDMTGGRPRISTDTDYLSNPDNYFIGFTMDHQDDNEAEQWAWRADLEFAFDDDSWLKSVKGGVRWANRDQTLINTGYNWVAVIQPWMQWWALSGTDPLPTIADLGLGDVTNINTFDNFYRGDVPVPGAVVALTPEMALGYPDTYYDIHNGALPYYTCCFYTEENGVRVTNFAPTLINDNHINKQDQTVSSAYLMVRFGWDFGLDGNIGVRFVETENTASGYVIYPNTSSFPVEIQQAFPTEPLYQNAANTYNNTLPSLNLRYRITDELIARFSYSQAMFRPNFSDMQAYLQLYLNLNAGAPNGSTDLNDYNGSASGGNPWLEPMEADQYDLSLEWYYADVGSAWLNLFRKDIDGFIRTGRYTREYAGFPYLIQAPANQDKAKLDGWEAGWRHFWDFGFGIEASYTYIDSSTDVTEQTIPVDTDGTPYNPDSLPYEGLSESSYSAIFMFENERWSARLAYTWRDEFLVSIGPNGFNGNNQNIQWQLPVFQEDYGQWDGSIFFNINDNFAIGLEANNLTNEEIILSGRQLNSPGGKTYSVQDSRYALTLRGNF